jgi:hypothetical protein
MYAFNNWDEYGIVKHENVSGFEIVTTASRDLDRPDDAFVVRVEAQRMGHTLGEAYLHGCNYDDPQQFIEAMDYYDEMKRDVIAQARIAQTKIVPYDQLKAFAIGYRDGVEEGIEDCKYEQDDLRHMYRRGYDSGVADYCHNLSPDREF